MKRLIRIEILALILLFTIGVCGCDMKYNDNFEQQIISEMERHLSNKYGDIQYDIESFFQSGWDRKCDLLNLRTTIDEIDYHFSVERYVNGESVTFKDNYFGILIKQEYEDNLYDCASKYFESCFVDASTMSINYPNELDSNSNFSDMISLKDEIDSKIVVVVVVDEIFSDISEFEKTAEDFCNDWEKIGLPVVFRVIYVSHETYLKINHLNFRDYGVLSDNRIAEFSR